MELRPVSCGARIAKSDKGTEKEQNVFWLGEMEPLLTSPSPLGLPKIICACGCCKFEGGLPPPLAEGWGMGAGECAGEVMRGLPVGIGMGLEPARCGVLWAMAGEESKPKRIPGLAPPTGPPFPKWPLRPFGMVTEDFRSWPGPPLMELPWTTAGAPAATVGTAGGIERLPFTGETDAVFACCVAGADEPTTTGGGLDPVAINGVEPGFLVAPAALAYDEAEGTAG